MKQKRILCINDISSMGKCSLTIALPIISSLGIEAVVLPTALLSAHTVFEGYTFSDQTEEMKKILKGLSINHPDFISVTFTLDLDNINLREDKTAHDVLDLF